MRRVPNHMGNRQEQKVFVAVLHDCGVIEVAQEKELRSKVNKSLIIKAKRKRQRIRKSKNSILESRSEW